MTLDPMGEAMVTVIVAELFDGFTPEERRLLPPVLALRVERLERRLAGGRKMTDLERRMVEIGVAGLHEAIRQCAEPVVP